MNEELIYIDKLYDSNLGSGVLLTNYTSYTSAFNCPSDGYVSLSFSDAYRGGFGTIHVNNVPMLSCTRDYSYTLMSLFVKAGMKIHVTDLSSDATAVYYPLD